MSLPAHLRSAVRPGTRPPPRIAAFSAGLRDAYLRFAARGFGRKAYQACGDYLDWLYRDRPGAPGAGGDFFCAIDERDRVVGCVHKLRAPWLVGDQVVDIPAVHNLMVAPDHRSGTGLRLLMAALVDERHAFIPAAGAVTAGICAGLRMQEIAVSWYRRLAFPPAWATVVGGAGALLGRGRWLTGDARVDLRDGVTLVRRPDPAALAASLARLPDGGVRPQYPAEWVAWRLLAERGPIHAVLGRDGLDEVAVLSLGPRRRLLVGRFIELRARSTAGVRALLAAGSAVLARAGAHLVTATARDPATQGGLAAAGWRPLPSPPRSFFHHRRKETFDGVSFGGSVGDAGLEAIAVR